MFLSLYFFLYFYFIFKYLKLSFKTLSFFFFCSRVPPPALSDPSVQDANYVPMIPLTPSLPSHPSPATGDQASLGRQVPPPAHMGFRNSPLTPVTPLTPTLRRNTMNTAGELEVEATPPPIHRNLKPQRKGGCRSLSGIYSSLCVSERSSDISFLRYSSYIHNCHSYSSCKQHNVIKLQRNISIKRKVIQLLKVPLKHLSVVYKTKNVKWRIIEISNNNFKYYSLFLNLKDICFLNFKKKMYVIYFTVVGYNLYVFQN